MTTKFCPECGTGHDCEIASGLDPETAAVKIARLETQRDIEVARIQAGAAKVIAETEADSAADELEGVLEGVELATGAGEPPDPGTGDPIVVQLPDDTSDDPITAEEP